MMGIAALHPLQGDELLRPRSATGPARSHPGRPNGV